MAIQKNNIGYRIVKSSNLIIESFCNEITASDLINNKLRIINNKDFDKNYSFLLDFRNADLKISHNDIPILVSTLKEFPVLQSNRRIAYLTNKPNEVVLTTLFSIAAKDIPIKPQIFSTIEAVINYLGLYTLNKEELESIIKEVSISISWYYSIFYTSHGRYPGSNNTYKSFI